MISVYLALISLVWGYTVFEYGGIVRSNRLVSLLALGIIALTYRIATRRIAAPPLRGALGWSVVLLPAYVALQLVPLPVRVLEILSPARAELIRGFNHLGFVQTIAPLSALPEATMKDFLLVCGYTLLFLLVRDMGWQFAGKSWRLAAPIVIVGGAEAALGLAQAFNGQRPDAGIGTYVNRDHYAALLTMALPFAVAYPLLLWHRAVKTRRDIRIRTAFVICALFGVCALILLGIVYSLSRMGFVSALFSLLVMGVVTWLGRGRKWLLALALMAIGLLGCFIFLSPDPLIARFGQISSVEAMTSEGRLLLWKESLRVFRAFPVFGCGLGAFESVFMRYKVSLPMVSDAYVHNDYLQSLIELGSIGFAILVVLFVGIGRKALWAALHSQHSSARSLSIACIGAFAAMGLHSMVDFALYTPANAMLLAWISGILASLDVESDRPRKQERKVAQPGPAT